MRILVVEDEPGIASFIKQGLEEEGYNVDIANEGQKGYDLAVTNDYDSILLDWMLPKLNGLDFCTKFRDEGHLTPIIFLTAKDTLQDTIQGLKAGANDYIKKPFHFEELIERIKVQLRANSNEHDILSINDIEMNLSAHTVTKNGEEIPFTPKEFALLEYLLRNKGRACSRTKIIENVWDIHFDYDTSVIDVYINAIRKKLKITKDKDFIHTIRGLGYIIK